MQELTKEYDFNISSKIRLTNKRILNRMKLIITKITSQTKGPI
jgi:hypothetical protein